jgi:hypothetical protein
VTLYVNVTNSEGNSTFFNAAVSVDPFFASGWAGINIQLHEPPLIYLNNGAWLIPGTTTYFSYNVANDDGTFTYAWSSSCGGQFGTSSGSSGLMAYDIPADVADAACGITLKVTDQEGSSSAVTIRMVVSTTGPVLVVPPQIDSAQQSALTYHGSSPITLTVQAHSPRGIPVQFAWSASQGVVLSQPDYQGGQIYSSVASWSLPAGTSPATATVVVTDSMGATATHSFTVTPAQ